MVIKLFNIYGGSRKIWFSEYVLTVYTIFLPNRSTKLRIKWLNTIQQKDAKSTSRYKGDPWNVQMGMGQHARPWKSESNPPHSRFWQSTGHPNSTYSSSQLFTNFMDYPSTHRKCSKPSIFRIPSTVQPLNTRNRGWYHGVWAVDASKMTNFPSKSRYSIIYPLVN